MRCVGLRGKVVGWGDRGIGYLELERGEGRHPVVRVQQRRCFAVLLLLRCEL